MTMMNALCLGLAGLRPVERRFLVLHYEHDLTSGELAELYEMPTAKVERVLQRAWEKYDFCLASIRW